MQDSRTRLAANATCQLGRQQGLLDGTPTCGFSMWPGLPTAWQLGSERVQPKREEAQADSPP